MISEDEKIARHVSIAMARRARETEAQIERMLAREQADIRSAIETKNSVDGKASAPRLRLQEIAKGFARASEAAAEVARQIAVGNSRAAR